jgi:hypothetical protein
MGKHNQKSRKNPKRRAALAKQKNGVDWFVGFTDESSNIPEDFEAIAKPKVSITYIDYSTVERTEIDWVKGIVTEHFKRAEHGI